MLKINKLIATGGAAAVGLLATSAPVLAQEATLDTGDTAWMLTSTALVLMMTIPGLAMFYGGHGPAQERAGDGHAELRGGRADDGPVDGRRLLVRVW